ncbi:MAG: hypothetical protein ACYTDX_02755 [Planctomycetota bacterium]|jgi:hypothetical protein
MRTLLVLAVMLFTLPACAATSTPEADMTFGADLYANAQDSVDIEQEDDSSFVGTLVLWLPNRVLDLFDIAKAGVNAGPGIGVNAKATDFAQGMFLNRTSVGVGLQTLRSLPAYAGVESAVGAGPLGVDMTAGLGWDHSPTDVRLEVHPVLAGAHVAVDPVAIVDFILGIFTIDISDDDL